MGAILDDEDTIEAETLSTSFDPYGQLVKMLMPRAACIAIYDRMGVPLWFSDGAEGPDLMQLAEEALSSARDGQVDPRERDGLARAWDGDTAYVFIMRDGATLLGALAISCQDGSSGSRPFSVVQGLLRPALQVLARELVNQHSIGHLRRDLDARQGDIDLLLEANDGEQPTQDLDQLLRRCVLKLEGSMGGLLVPEKKIALTYGEGRKLDAALLDKTQRHLFAWMQVQRRTLMLNKAPPNSPLGALACKIIACPIRHDAQSVSGLLLLFRAANGPDFELREARLLEMIARGIGRSLQNAFDSATGLLTRSTFEQQVLAMLNVSAGSASNCIAYADIDALHRINDNFGMHVGDAVIAHVGELIRTQLPSHVLAARIAGDRFAVFAPNTSVEAAESMLEQLCAQVSAAHFTHEGEAIGVSLSFGVASTPQSRLPLSHALAIAEAACKAAKERGRARVAKFEAADESTLSATAPQRVAVSAPEPAAARPPEDPAMLCTLRDAIASDRFRMEAQPIVQLGAPGPARRYELLLRMIDLNGASVAPDKFLAAAERYELATDIDRWVVQYALEILSSAAPALEHLGAQFSINISGQSLGDAEFPDFLAAKLREYALPAHLLSFEIKESAAVANIVRAETLIRQLQQLGHDIALDDFGRGLSSLTYLKSLSVSHLKIDGGLIRDVGNSRSQTAVNAIVQLARTRKLATTAECVESEALLKAVSKLGIDYGQGFAIGRPRPLEIVLQELLKSAPGALPASGAPRMARLAV